MQSNKESNQKLIERFPFLMPRNRWTGKVPEDYDYEVYALTWDDVFQSFDLRHAFLLDKLKMDEEAIAAEIAQTAGDEKSKDTADALTALVAN